MQNTADLSGKTVAFVATRGVEQVELTSPWQAVTQAGVTPRLVSVQAESITAMQGDWEHGDTFPVDVAAAEADAGDFDALVLPGGTLNADALRVDESVRAFVRDFVDQGKPIAAICHAPWTLIDADLVSGRTMTSYVSVRRDLENAGAVWKDEQVVVDGQLITSRSPEDLDAFNAALVEKLAEG